MQRVRKEFWGYAPDENLSHDDLIPEKYQRHPPGARLSGAARPHREGDAVQAARRRERAGVKLTESFAMWPGSSVSGLYFSHPESHYFGVGKIERDQVEDYAARKGWSVAEAERWLAPVLNYIPTQDRSAQDRRVREAMPTSGADGCRAGQRQRRQGRGGTIGLASAGLHLRGASRLAQDRGGAKAGSRRPGECVPTNLHDRRDRAPCFAPHTLS